MHFSLNQSKRIAAMLLGIVLILPGLASATIVRIETVLGDFEVNLYDNATPATVANFLAYAQNGDYTDAIVHRSVGGFIIQSGAFRTDVNAQLSDIPTNPAVVNEPVYSNVRGTIAMAKLPGDPDSATNQWFINLGNNAANLDNQNGGFTVFGEVTGNGMAIVDAIAALPTFAFASPLEELPLRNYSATDFANNVDVDNTHLMIVTGMTVTDTTVDSAGAAGLTPTPTTATDPVNNPPSSGGGGGALGFLILFGLLFALRKRFI